VRAPRRGPSFLVTVLAVLLEPLAVDLDVLLVLVVGVGELRLPRVRVRGHEELPVALGRVECGLHRTRARGVDRSGRQSLLLVRVVRRVRLWLLLRRRYIRASTVDVGHGGVGLQQSPGPRSIGDAVEEY